jgi:class 3 adenylate cyclase
VKGSGPRAGRASERKWTATSHNRYENQALAEVAIALSETRQLGCVRDHRWRVVYGTDELRLLYGANLELAPLAVGFHLFGPEQVSASLQWRNGPNTIEINRVQFVALGGMVLADTPGGRGQLRELVHPALQDIVDRLSPAQPAAVSFMSSGATVAREIVDVPVLAMRIRDRDGRLVGTAVIAKPAAGMATLAAMAAAGDLPLPADAARRPATRRPTALLFDLEASSPLARRLSTAAYFALGRRLVGAADRCAINAGGLVGRHVGDGSWRSFWPRPPGRNPPPPATASRPPACFKPAADSVATRSNVQPGELIQRFGLHWGSTPYVGSITYTALTDLATAGEKAHRDAPATAVCEL